MVRAALGSPCDDLVCLRTRRGRVSEGALPFVPVCSKAADAVDRHQGCMRCRGPQHAVL